MSKTRHYIDYVKRCEKIIKKINKDLQKIRSREYKLMKKTNLSKEEKVLLDELKKCYSSKLEWKVQYEFELQLIKLEAVKEAYKLPSKAKKLGLEREGYIKYLKAEYLRKLDNEISGYRSYDWAAKAKNRAEYINYGINSYLSYEQRGFDDIYNIFSDVEMDFREADKIARR